jgi:iron complex transport system permease protein
MTVRDQTAPMLVALSLALCAAVLVSCFLGSVPIASAEILAGLLGRGGPSTQVILWEIRLPRALAALLVGAALGASGAALQGLLRNPLAEPGVLGVSASASLCATIAIFWGFTQISPWVLPTASIFGALAATALLAALAPRVGGVVTLILVGVALSSVMGAIMMLLLNLAPNPFSLADMINWTMGSVANRSFLDIAFISPFWLIGWALLLMSRRGLVGLGLGEEGARAIGLNVSAITGLVILGAGLMTGAAVSIAGAVGFVGIVAPHIVRPFVGHDPGRALIPSALFGAFLLVMADLITRLIPSAQEIKLGVIVALVGAPVFIVIALRQRDQGGLA